MTFLSDMTLGEGWEVGGVGMEGRRGGGRGRSNHREQCVISVKTMLTLLMAPVRRFRPKEAEGTEKKVADESHSFTV